MKILVANLGSTSFKYRLFKTDAEGETCVARDGYERVEDFGPVIEDALDKLVAEGHLENIDDLDAVGFKTVLGKNLSGCVEAGDAVLEALEGLEQIAPAHNPAYASGIRQFRRLTSCTLVALFETSFYQWVPEYAKRYAVPQAWHDVGIRRYGFHGASHKYIAERSSAILGRPEILKRVENLYVSGPGHEPEGPPLRVVSCHLGGSSSVTGMRNGIAIGTSMGMSPQGGLPQNNRVGDLDSMAIPMAIKDLGLSMDEVLDDLTKKSGLLGLSGVGNDFRDIEAAAASGDKNARLAVDFLAASIRHWIGAFTFQMGGLEAIVFTAGIGENRADLRQAVCSDLQDLGIILDPDRNNSPERGEREISSKDSRVRVLVIPTNEEQVVVRETRRLIEKQTI